MKIKHSLVLLSVFSLITLSSCFDNDYDLSDIDTTVRLQTKELTVPITLENVTLSQVLDLDDDSEIVETTDANGNRFYAIKKTGDFSSDPIDIEEFTMRPTDIESTTSILELKKLSDLAGSLPDDLLNETGLTAYYDITSEPTSFEEDAQNVDEALKSLDWIGVETQFAIKVKIEGEGLNQEILNEIKFKGLRIKFPEGLEATSELGFFEQDNPSILNLTGETLTPDTNGEVSIRINVTGIDPVGDHIDFDSEAHTFAYHDHIQVLEGHVIIYRITDNLPPTISFTSTPILDAIEVKTITGEIEYNVEEFEISPVNLNDLPDILSQSGTRIWLENPQIYLKVNNPVAEYNAYFETGLQFKSTRDDEEVTYNTEKISTKKETGRQSKDNYFVLSPDVAPTPDIELAQDYPNPEHIRFDGLRNILAGEYSDESPNTLAGIPTKIEIKATNPNPGLPQQQVTHFRLGRTLEAINGTYAFYAPLLLSDNSRIAYEETVDGWSDDDLDDITIKKISLSFDATTDIPFEVALTIHPVDKDGHIIAAETEPVNLPAKAENYPVEAIIEGTISHFDGIRIKATIRVDNKDEQTPLAPEMTIGIKNSKAVVTGYYEAEL